MPLKDLVAAGLLGQGLSSFCQTMNTLANQYASAGSPLAALLASYGLAAQVPDTPANQAALQQILSSVPLPTPEQYAAATTGRFTAADAADADAILVAAAMLVYCAAKLQASLPLNDV